MDDIKIISLISALQSYRYTFADEVGFQDGIEWALADAWIPTKREYDLAPHGTIDFLCDDIGIEAKIKGNRHALMRQVARYLKHKEISGVIIASTKQTLLAGIPQTLDGKFIRTVYLGSAF